MIRREVLGRRSAFGAVLLAAVLTISAASPVTADPGKERGHGRKAKHTIVHRDRVRCDDHRAFHHARDRHDRVVEVHRWPSPRIEDCHRAAWAWYPARITHWAQRPFWFHDGFHVFFGGDAFWLDVGNVPPPGYRYRDPYCQRTFGTIWDYQIHLGRHHHAALIDVVVADSPYPYRYAHIHDGCGHR